MSSPSVTGDNRTLNITSLDKNDVQPLEATYRVKDKAGKTYTETLGQLNVVAYDKQVRKLYLVPLNKGSYNATTIKNVGADEIKIAIKAKKYLAAGLALVGATKTSFDLTSSLTSYFLSQNDKDKISKYPGGDFFISKWENISPYLELNLFASNIAATVIIEGFESFTSSWEVIKLNSDLRKELGENKIQLINKFSDNLSALIIEAKQ